MLVPEEDSDILHIEYLKSTFEIDLVVLKGCHCIIAFKERNLYHKGAF